MASIVEYANTPDGTTIPVQSQASLEKEFAARSEEAEGRVQDLKRQLRDAESIRDALQCGLRSLQQKDPDGPEGRLRAAGAYDA